jgi:hypothetical protein
VVGVPAAADIGLLLGLLAHFGDLGMALHGLEEAVDVDRRPAARELEVLLGRELLVAEEDDAMLGEGRLHLIPLAIAHRLDIDAQNLGAAATRELLHLDRFVSHDPTSWVEINEFARRGATAPPTR